jgi:hypothetical protein
MTTEEASGGAREIYIDPDPYSVIACWIAAAALVLQFVDFVRDRQPPAVAAQVLPNAIRLDELENSLEEVERNFELLMRTIERGSKNPDGEFFDAEFGIGRASLKLEQSRHGTFSSQLADTLSKLSALSLWSNHIIGKQPDAASILGHAIMADLSLASDRLNGLMRVGAKNRELISECRHVIATLRLALNALLQPRSN